MELPTLSPLRISADPTTGEVSVYGVEGLSHVSFTVDYAAIQVEGTPPAVDWLAALNLPKDFEKLKPLAQAAGYSSKRVQFIIADESELPKSHYRRSPNCGGTKKTKGIS